MPVSSASNDVPLTMPSYVPIPEILYDYATGELNDVDKNIVEDHLELCGRCAEEVSQIRLIEENIFQSAAEESMGKYMEEPFPVTAVYDHNKTDLTDDYHPKPLGERLIASTASSELIFPITVEYQDGQVVGQFWKRAGHLFYRLQHCSKNLEQFVCTLVYTSKTDPSDIRTFDFHEGEDKRLGARREFIASNTKQDMLDAMRQFQLFFKQKE